MEVPVTLVRAYLGMVTFWSTFVLGGGGGNGTFPRNTCIINISMYFGATEKWHVQMVMVIACCTIGGSVGRAPWNTRLSIAQFMQDILMKADV